jgi:nicotinamide-nucleotide amidase
MSKSVVILSTGEELLTGETVDTNSAWLAASLWGLGAQVRSMLTAGDDMLGLVRAIRTACEHGSVVICTGGLGPTDDDRTAQAVAAWAGLGLSESTEAMTQIESRYRTLGREVSAANRKQAMLPDGAIVLENRWGTAPGFSVGHNGSTIFCLPGVPMEMRHMFKAHIAALLSTSESPTLVRMRTFGVAESRLQTMMNGLDLGGADLGFRAHIPEVQIKLRFPTGTSADAQRRVVGRVSDVLGESLYSVDGGDLAENVIEVLSQAGETLSLAESCTAGMTSAWLAEVPGASAVLMEGVIVYSNESKERSLGVGADVIADNGAVSKPVALALAEGIRSKAGTTWGIGITGIAGPGGGSEAKPVGTVHIAVAGPSGTRHQTVVIPGDRNQVRIRAAGTALALLLRCRN